MMIDDITKGKQDDDLLFAWVTPSPHLFSHMTPAVSFCSPRQEEITEESDTHPDWREA
jgi:hypothetical protein